MSLLEDGRVYCHPFVTGELASGHMSRPGEILELLENLPAAVAATHSEVLRLVEFNRLWGRGLGWLDVHLLASARLSGVGLWTKDRRPATAAATTSPRGLGEEQRVRGQAPATSFGPRPLPAPSAACGGFLPR